jgi:hypothetical protein
MSDICSQKWFEVKILALKFISTGIEVDSNQSLKLFLLSGQHGSRGNRNMGGHKKIPDWRGISSKEYISMPCPQLRTLPLYHEISK